MVEQRIVQRLELVIGDVLEANALDHGPEHCGQSASLHAGGIYYDSECVRHARQYRYAVGIGGTACKRWSCKSRAVRPKRFGILRSQETWAARCPRRPSITAGGADGYWPRAVDPRFGSVNHADVVAALTKQSVLSSRVRCAAGAFRPSQSGSVGEGQLRTRWRVRQAWSSREMTSNRHSLDRQANRSECPEVDVRRTLPRGIAASESRPDSRRVVAYAPSVSGYGDAAPAPSGFHRDAARRSSIVHLASIQSP
jgi:hypothetical protein